MVPVPSLSRFLLQSNEIYEAIKAFKWYLLPQKEMQNYLILLHNAQQSKILYVAGILPLNMETCVTVRISYVHTHNLNNCI